MTRGSLASRRGAGRGTQNHGKEGMMSGGGIRAAHEVIGRKSVRFASACGLLLLGVLAACSIQPQPVHLGSEECGHCRMVISELQFASQALTTKGKAYKFDAVECLASWVRTGDVQEADLHSLWVSDFAEPGEWVRAADATFLHAPALRSPMGQGLAAFASADVARDHVRELGGHLMSWDEVLDLVDLHRNTDHGRGHRAHLGAPAGESDSHAH
jgi:copper chaperone NosL